MLLKTQAPTIDPEPFLIPKHDTFSGRDSRDRLLCPVLMLKYYIKFMGGFKSDTPLFQKCIRQGCVCAITIFKWFQICIAHTYKNENYQSIVKGHEVRKSSASYIRTMGSQLKDVMAAGAWWRQSTFTSHYIVDMHRQCNGKFRISPVVYNMKRQ